MPMTLPSSFLSTHGKLDQVVMAYLSTVGFPLGDMRHVGKRAASNNFLSMDSQLITAIVGLVPLNNKRLDIMTKISVKTMLVVVAALAPIIAVGGNPPVAAGAYHINYLGGPYGRSATTVYIPKGGRELNSISFHCDENKMRLEFDLNEMVDYHGEVDAYFEFPDGTKLRTDGGALDGISIGGNKSSSGQLKPTNRILENISGQAHMSVRVVGRLGSKSFEQSLSGAGEAISLSRKWCLGELK
ncbi:hypothetical protein [Pseudomonas extremaustralis]